MLTVRIHEDDPMTLLDPKLAAIRSHDIMLCMERDRTTEFDLLARLGLAVRLGLHLRGVPPVDYEILKKVAVHVLGFATAEVRPVLELLATAEHVHLRTEGATIRVVIPNVPFFDDVYSTLGAVATTGAERLTEHEQYTLALLNTLSSAPMLRDHAYNIGAEKKLVDNALHVGRESGFLLDRRARGRDVLISPTYFSESDGGYADLVAGHGSGRVRRVVDLLRSVPGMPLAVIEQTGDLGGNSLDPQERQIVRALAGQGFAPPPAIETSHHGTNHFIFAPRPSTAKVPANKRAVYERAMALVAAVRQGQLLPEAYRIRSPYRLLSALKERGFVSSSTEALEQYRQLAFMRVGRLVQTLENTDWYRLELINTPENVEALDMALTMVRGGSPDLSTDGEVTMALQQGQEYVESLVGRKLVAHTVIRLSADEQEQIDTLLLGVKA